MLARMASAGMTSRRRQVALISAIKHQDRGINTLLYRKMIELKGVVII